MFGFSAPLHAEWKDETGFTRLQLLAGPELPDAPTQGLTQGEAPDASNNYAPDVANANYTGKTFTLKSGASGASGHATTVADYFYGNTTSLLTGNIGIDVYNANGFISTNFLKTGTFSEPAFETRAVQNHSWIGITYSSAAEADQRLDYAINRDGFVCVVGENNGASEPLPELLGQSYHTISVGLANGNHSAGFTTIDGSGRIKPDIVAPESYTSFATPMVSGAAGLLYSKLAAAPYSLTGADKPRVIKALLMASATKDTVASWTNTAARPLDLRYGAGELNVNHAYNDLRAGRATASNSVFLKERGWSAETVASSSSKTYYFTIGTGTVSTPFSAALTWHRIVTDNRMGGQWGSLTTSMANLELHLHHANGFAVGALISESRSAVDNVELVYQSALAPGNYALVVENGPSADTPYALAWHSLPAVSITATVSTARESDLQQGVVTLTRTGDTTLALQVPLSISGTAISGSHYQALPASVIVPALQTSVSIPIIPVSDDLAQGSRSVVVSVAADFALVRDATQTATVTIEDKPFDAWRFGYFNSSELGDPATSGPVADPDSDQLQNLIEYALGLNPKSRGVTTASVTQSSGYLTLTAPKNPAATDISWSAEVTADLTHWTSAVTLTNTSTSFQARDSIPVSSAPKRLIRLKITRP